MMFDRITALKFYQLRCKQLQRQLLRRRPVRRRGLSLLELLAAVAIMGVIAMVVFPRITDSARTANEGSCQLRKAVIEIQVGLWRRERGRWPMSDLSDIGASVQYFPEGLPSCPVDGSRYTIDAVTGRVNGHRH